MADHVKLIVDNTLPGFDGGGEPPYDDGMDARVTRLETTIPTLATKLDLADVRNDIHVLRVEMHKELNAQTWKFVTWMTGICTALIAATYFIASHAGK